MAEEIEITIAPNGDVTVEGKGISGPDCRALTKEIEAALGTVTATKLKPEYHRTRVAKRTQGR